MYPDLFLYLNSRYARKSSGRVLRRLKISLALLKAPENRFKSSLEHRWVTSLCVRRTVMRAVRLSHPVFRLQHGNPRLRRCSFPCLSSRHGRPDVNRWFDFNQRGLPVQTLSIRKIKETPFRIVPCRCRTRYRMLRINVNVKREPWLYHESTYRETTDAYRKHVTRSCWTIRWLQLHYDSGRPDRHDLR